ncbi:MAG: virulence-associated E family protein [Cyanobacteria bacterium P01_B01_bin.77]
MTEHTNGYRPSGDNFQLLEPFDIRNHIDKLEPAKEKGKYICPVCNDDNFTIREKDGAFQCWSTGCETRAIMDAIAPLPDKPTSHSKPKQRTKPRKSRKEKDREIQLNAAELEAKISELVDEIDFGYATKEQALVTLAEWCKTEGRDKYSATKLFNAQLKAKLPISTDDDGPRLLKEYRLIEQHFGDRLQFNTLFKRVELDGAPFDPSAARIELIVTHGLSLKGSREDLADITVKLAKESEYSPVAKYLRNTIAEHDGNTDCLNNLASRYFGADDPIYQTLLQRFLVAAVARAIKPGCKHDCALILQGRQGDGKSTFLKTLASPEWFDDSLGAASDKDERLKLHQRWFLEWAELETVFKRKDVSQVKAFLSCATDLVRAPYARSSETMLRHSVIVGSTNESEFLSDPTGSRRFWIIPVKKRIDIAQLEEERDQIWAAATALYQRGEQWWLTPEEAQETELIAKRYESRDPWFERVADYVACMDSVTTNQVLAHAVQLDVDKFTTGHARRVSSILRILGWQQSSNPLSHDGRRTRIWKLTL